MDRAALVAILAPTTTGLSAFLSPPNATERRGSSDHRVRTVVVRRRFMGSRASRLRQCRSTARCCGASAWCSGTVIPHRDSVTPFGLAVLIGALAVAMSVGRVRVRQRRQSPTDERELAIVTSREPFAYSLPGQARPGCRLDGDVGFARCAGATRAHRARAISFAPASSPLRSSDGTCHCGDADLDSVEPSTPICP